MGLSDFDAWGSLFGMIVFLFFGFFFRFYFARPSSTEAEGNKKIYRGASIFFFIIAGIATFMVIGNVYFVTQVLPELQMPEQLDAVIPNGKNPIVRNGNTYYNAPLPDPTRAELLANQYAPGPSRANLLRRQATKIPNTPVA
jgi:hypothetical protein